MFLFTFHKKCKKREDLINQTDNNKIARSWFNMIRCGSMFKDEDDNAVADYTSYVCYNIMRNMWNVCDGCVC